MTRRSPRQPRLAFLRTFEVVARQRSFSLAAKELNLTISAVSRQIREVEDTLGVKLFNRLARGIELTGSGRTLLKGVENGLEWIGRACEQVRAIEGIRTIKISAPPTVAAYWLAPQIAEFASVNPDLQVRVISAEGEPDLSRDRVDLAILRVRAAALGDERPLLQETIFPVCSPNLPTDDRPLATPRDLVRHMLLHEDQVTAPELDWAVWLQHLGVRGANMTNGPRCSHFGLAISAAIDGCGVALGRSPLNDRDLRAGRLVRPFPDAEMASSRVYAVRLSRSAQGDQAVGKLERFLRQAAADGPQARNPNAQAR